MVLKAPLLQGRQVEEETARAAVLKVPAGQGEGKTEEAGQKVPAVQFPLQAAEARAEEPPYVPLGQGKHNVDPEVLKVPAGQAMGALGYAPMSKPEYLQGFTVLVHPDAFSQQNAPPPVQLGME